MDPVSYEQACNAEYALFRRYQRAFLSPREAEVLFGYRDEAAMIEAIDLGQPARQPAVHETRERKEQEAALREQQALVNEMCSPEKRRCLPPEDFGECGGDGTEVNWCPVGKTWMCSDCRESWSAMVAVTVTLEEKHDPE
jgi:hypothetical protein